MTSVSSEGVCVEKDETNTVWTGGISKEAPRGQPKHTKESPSPPTKSQAQTQEHKDKAALIPGVDLLVD